MNRAAMQLDIAPSTEQPEAAATPDSEDRAAALAELLAGIGDDARDDPHGYLGRTVVPEGGE